MSEPRRTQNAMKYAGLATQWMVMLLIAVWGGIKIDGLLKWKVPLFTILLPLIALVFSMWKLIKEVSNTKK